MTKLETIDHWRNRKVADVLLQCPKTIAVLERMNLPLEVHEKTLAEYCKETNTDFVFLMTIIGSFLGKPVEIANDSLLENTPRLVDYLRSSHDYFLNSKIPYMNSILDQFEKEANHPKTALLKSFFQEYCNEVNQHMSHEDKVVFPYVLRTYNEYSLQEKKDEDYMIIEFEEHHGNIEEKLSDLKNLLIKYFPTTKGSFIRNQFLLGLFDLECDLLDHAKLEDEILIPTVKKMELIISNYG